MLPRFGDACDEEAKCRLPKITPWIEKS